MPRAVADAGLSLGESHLNDMAGLILSAVRRSR